MLNLPREPHSAIVCGQTGCGKTQFVPDDLLHPDFEYYRDAFETIFVLYPTWKRNRTYLERLWLWRRPHSSRFFFIDPGERLHDWLRALFTVAADIPTLYHGSVKSAHKNEGHVVRVGFQWAPRKAVGVGSRPEVQRRV